MGGLMDTSLLEAIQRYVQLEEARKPFLLCQLTKMLQFVLANLVPMRRYQIVDLIKGLVRNRVRVKQTEFQQYEILNRLSKALRESASNNYWNGYSAAICLSHDIDYEMGHAFVPNMAEINLDHGVTASFNFLTGWDYEIDHEVVSSLVEQGFEIGLHGHTHDIALGCRRRSRIEKDLRNSLDFITRYAVSGFRAPALSIGDNLLAVLSRLGLTYDSSFSGVDRYTGVVSFCLPFRFTAFGMWEIPLSIQDTYFFRDRNLSDTDALEEAISIMDAIVAMGGVAVINCHPCIVKNHLEFYRGVLSYIAKQNRVWNPCLIDLVLFLKNRSDANVQGHENWGCNTSLQ